MSSEVDVILGPSTVIASSAERTALGLHHWIDGTFGVVRFGGRELVMAPNGATSARHDLSRGGLLEGLEQASVTIHCQRDPAHHASGGPLWRDPDSGCVLMMYHGERFTNGDAGDYYSYLGLAVSDDDGATFRDLGPVLTSDLAEQDPDRHRPLDVGPGGFVVRDGWLTVYYFDRGVGPVRVNLGAARASVAEVIGAATDGRCPRFDKYFQGGWGEPGLGGQGTDLLAGTAFPVLWFDVAHVVAVDRILLVWSTVVPASAGQIRWRHLCAFSPDGLAFTDPICLYEGAEGSELLYLTIDSGGEEQRTILDDRFDLYRVRSSTPFRWDDGQLERVTVTLRGSVSSA